MYNKTNTNTIRQIRNELSPPLPPSLSAGPPQWAPGTSRVSLSSEMEPASQLGQPQWWWKSFWAGIFFFSLWQIFVILSCHYLTLPWDLTFSWKIYRWPQIKTTRIFEWDLYSPKNIHLSQFSFGNNRVRTGVEEEKEDEHYEVESQEPCKSINAVHYL